MKGIDIVYHADNNTMEWKDAPEDLLIGTDGDDYANYLRFQIIDNEGILDGFTPYVLFEAESRPMIELDESYTLNLTQELLNKARYGKLPFMLVFKGKESTIEIHSVNTLTLGIAHSIDADREVKDDTYHSELAIKYVEITYHAESRLMELTDMPDDQFVGTDGDDYATYLRFHMDDPNGLLVGYGARVEFDVSIKDDNGDVYKPFIIIDESMSVPLIQRILSNVKYGAIPIQLAFKGTDSEGRSSQYYSLNKLRLSISDSIRALEGVDVNDRIDINSAINDVEYNTKTATFSFRQIDGGTIAIQLSDLSEEHFEVSTKDDLKKLNKAQNGDTATTLDDGKWYALYGAYDDIQSWKVMSPSVKAVDDHISDRGNPHNVTKTQIGLGNVDDTSDIDKPISTATQNALDTKADSQELSELSKIVSEEIADRKFNDGAINESISNHVSDKDNPHNVTKEQLGLENVDNTSDADKPISTATQTAIDEKVSKSGDTMTGALKLKEALQFIAKKGDVSTLPSAWQINGQIIMRDVNNVGMGVVRWDETASQRRLILTTEFKPDADTSYSSEMRLVCESNGASYITAPTPSSTSDNSTKLSTTAWINSADVICRTVGNQTIDGEKTFTGVLIREGSNPWFYMRNTKFTTGTTPSVSNYNWNIFFKDKGENDAGFIKCLQYNDNGGILKLRIYNNDQSMYGDLDIVASVKKGYAYALAPSTPTDAKSNEIATANWVNDKFSALPKVYRPCGSVATFDQLPTNASIGDVYNVESDNQNYAWVEIDGVQKWDSLGATIDLTQYYTKTDVDSKVSEVRTIADGKVSKSGDTMTGVLFITRGLPQSYLKNTTDDYTVAFTGSTPATLKFLGYQDKNGKDTFHLSEYVYNGGRGISMALSDASSGSVKSANIGLTVEKNGVVYATAPTPSSTTDNSIKIATTEWINSADIICRTVGNQTVGGEKVFTTRPIVQTGLNSGLIVKSTDFDRTATFTAWTRPFHIVAYDKNGQYVSIIQSYADQNNMRNLDLILYTANGNQQTLGIRYDETSKVGYGVAPTTPTDANSNEIATAKWVNDRFVNVSGDTMTGELIAKGGVRSDFIRKYDANNQNVGFVLFEETEASNTASLNARKSTGTNTAVYPALKLYANSDATYYATLHSNYIGWNDNSDKVLTIKMANSLPSLVHTTSNETVDGVKTFSSVPKISTWAQILGVPSEVGWTKVATITKSGSALNRYCALIEVHTPYHRKSGLLNIWAFGSSVFTDCGADWVYNFGYTPNEVAVHLDTSGTVSVWISQGTNRTQTMFKCVEQYGMWGLDLTSWIILDTDSREFSTTLPTEGTIHYSTSSKVTTPSADATGTEVVNANWTIGKFVALDGNQTIAGQKTFTSGIYHKGNNPVIHQNSTLINKGTKPSATNMSGIRYGDADGNILGGFRYVIRPNGNGEVYSEIQNFDGSVTAMLRAIATADGKTYAEAPTPSDSADNSTKIPTTAWISTADCIFHTIGNENVAGIKSYNDEICMKSRTEYNDATYQTSSNFTFRQGSQFTGSIKTVHDASNDNCIAIETKNPTTGKNAVLRVISKADGTAEMRLISDGVWHKIATEGWANSNLVKKSGDTMTSRLQIHQTNWPSMGFKATNIDVMDTNISGDNRTLYIECLDKNGKPTFFQSAFLSKDNTRGLFTARTYDTDGNAKDCDLSLWSFRDGTAYVTVPTPTNKADNSTKIATTEWCQTSSALVHSTGNETIAGVKTFTGIQYLNASYGNLRFNMLNLNQSSTPPTERQVNYIHVKGKDKDGKESTVWQLETIQGTDGLKIVQLATNFVNWDDGTSNWKYPFRVIQQTDKSVKVTTVNPKSDANSDEIVTASWSLGKFVSKSGDTMTGALTFNTPETNVIFITNPSADMIAGTSSYPKGIYYKDKNGQNMGVIRVNTRVSGAGAPMNYLELTQWQTKSDGSTQVGTLTVNSANNGESWATAPSWSVGTNDNSDKVLTIKMANSLPSLCHSTGNETWAGSKSFTGSITVANNLYMPICIKHTNLDSTVTDSQESHIYFRDKNDVLLGRVSASNYAIKTFGLTTLCNDAWHELAMKKKTDGTIYAVAPSTPTNATSNEIATANWVNNKLAYVNVEYTSGSSSYTYKLTNVEDGALVSGVTTYQKNGNVIIMPFTFIYTSNTGDVAGKDGIRVMISGANVIIADESGSTPVICHPSECTFKAVAIKF